MTTVNDIELACGNFSITARIPGHHLAGIFTPQPIPASSDPSAEIKQALANPLDSLRLQEIVSPGEKLVILIDDHTRVTPTALILPILLDNLHQAGCREEDITIFITHGTHRLSTAKDLARRLSPPKSKH